MAATPGRCRSRAGRRCRLTWGKLGNPKGPCPGGGHVGDCSALPLSRVGVRKGPLLLARGSFLFSGSGAGTTHAGAAGWICGQAGARRASTSLRCCGPSDRGNCVARRFPGREPACSPPSLTRPVPCAVSRAPTGCSRRRRWSPRRTARSPLGSRSAPSTRSSSSEGTWPSRGGVTRATPTGPMGTPIRPAAPDARRLRRFRYGLTVCVLALERLGLNTASPL